MSTQKIYNPIFITGIERSGSSIVAKVIQACGVFSGATTSMMENKEIKSFVDEHYRKNNFDVRGQFPLPDTSQILIPTNWRSEIETCLHSSGYRSGEWMYKSSRLAQLWPIWNNAYPNAKWVIVRRRTGDVISSCQKTAFMNAFEDKGLQKLFGFADDREGWLWWVHQQEQSFRDMIETGLNCKVIWPERILDGNFSQLYETLDWLGLRWNPKVLTILNDTLIKK